MKKVIFLLTVILLIACSENDESVTSQQVELFVDHYKTTSIINGTAFVIYENVAPGNNADKIYGQINRFNFEPGFTYQLTANKTIIENAGTNAQTVRYDLITINNKEAVSPDAEFRIPLIQFFNGRGTATFIRRQADSTFILSNEIPFNCNYFCVDLDRAIERETAIEGTFTHGPEGTYILQELAN
ncbi:MAG: DUF4377 domain-containing protein [Bacteroidia bacterium]|nr:DUF4377 domain-containing protein [Bacteroidia bacterium]MBT8276358.1 DUF4377 domain-containing protein [Bacteroidia bacterium]NNJ81899.1 DUF4377 domain-containing protein [Flavobacteriaceae bacterium]NNK55006.1 DUF4377 domain-containing protein [Flavobacteriaceae bacterium]NNM08643.1 DUF4377 domain-containing protein [Flavobacteriaceae bacterium]